MITEEKIKEENKKDIKKILYDLKDKKEYRLYLEPTIINCIKYIAEDEELTLNRLIEIILISIISKKTDDLPELLNIILDGVDQGEKRKQTKKNNLLKSFNLDEEIIKEELKPIKPDVILTEPIKEEEHLTPKLTEEEDSLNRIILLIKENGDRADNSNLDRILKGNKTVLKDIKTSKDDILKLLDKMEGAPTKNGIKNLIGYLDPKDKYKRKRI